MVAPRSPTGTTPALRGLRIAVTRPRAQAESLAAGLERLGAEVVEIPLIHIEAPADPGPLRAAARSATSYDFVAFTSANAVAALWQAAAEAGIELRGVRAASVGPATSAALRERGVEPALEAERHHAEGLLAAMLEAGVRGKRVLLPQAADARAVLADGLRAGGAQVETVIAYRAVDAPDAVRIREPLRAGMIDVVTFTASSAVRSFLRVVGADPGRARVAVIGPVTAATARAGGLPVHIMATEHTVPGLLEAIAAACGEVGKHRSEER